MKRPDFISLTDWRLLEQKYQNMDYPIRRIENGYPIQYLIGNVDFYGYKIMVNKNVLIPRFETETLVEKTLKYIDEYKFNKASVLEIGTGSGCISIALKIAKKNAKLNKCKITFIKQDVNKCKLFNNYDVLISNPPYLKETDVLDEKTRFEPHNALFGGKDGLKFYPVIFGVAKKYLNKKFLIALEIDEDNGKEIKALAKEAFPKAKVKLEKDLTGRDRYIFVINE